MNYLGYSRQPQTKLKLYVKIMVYIIVDNNVQT